MGGSKRSKLRMRSSIDRLPSDARQALEEMIADPYNGLSYADMAEEIEDMCGERLSTSAIGRHAQRYMRDKKRVDIVLERMRIMAEYSQDHALPDVSRFINALIQDGLMRRILDGSEEFAEMDFEAALKYSIQAQRAAVYEYRYKDSSCVQEEIDGTAVADERLHWLRGLMRDKPELMAEIEKSYNEAAMAAPLAETAVAPLPRLAGATSPRASEDASAALPEPAKGNGSGAETAVAPCRRQVATSPPLREEAEANDLSVRRDSDIYDGVTIASQPNTGSNGTMGDTGNDRRGDTGS